ncbi:helix-turn-helix domain-containing protein [Sphingomonas sp. IC081]|uniref:helix-turn-helix domain-containing protein n=1 Tax=Sphingomonas sp. IC081 TaxID=304378 RepID=UPI001158CDF9|nr:helix-turn-helix domain-containing protein [Sphingomonas sp. IC081]QDK34555.1 hypothetical protein DM450_17595 [Sphingomonas sp. IC081]
MNAVSFGNLLAGAASIPTSEARVRFWRRTFDVNDSRAQVGRILGDGSARQGKIVLATIVEVAKKWFKHANEDARIAFAADRAASSKAPATPGAAPQRRRVLKWNVLNTLDAVLGFTNFKTGECIATYEMIAGAAECGRDTVYRHLNILRDLGLIDWVRRCEPTDNKKQPTKAAPNAYFFEITRLPSPIQMTMRQILKRRGVTLASHPERSGSGKVPNRVQRLADRLGKTLTGAADFLRRGKERDAKVGEAAFVRAETDLMGDIPTDQWAAIRHPGDAAAQAAYNARLGILSFASESMEMPLHSPPTEPDRKD